MCIHCSWNSKQSVNKLQKRLYETIITMSTKRRLQSHSSRQLSFHNLTSWGCCRLLYIVDQDFWRSRKNIKMKFKKPLSRKIQMSLWLCSSFLTITSLMIQVSLLMFFLSNAPLCFHSSIFIYKKERISLKRKSRRSWWTCGRSFHAAAIQPRFHGCNLLPLPVMIIVAEIQVMSLLADHW